MSVITITDARGKLAALVDDSHREPVHLTPRDRPEWRVRTGDYRVIYRIDDGVLVIVVVDLGHRREIDR